MDRQSETRRADPQAHRRHFEEPLTAGRITRNGLTFRADGSRQEIVDAVAGFGDASSYDVESFEDGAGVTIVSLRRRARGLARFEAHPSRLDCAVVDAGETTLLAIDRSFSLAYALHCFALCCLTAILLIGASYFIDPNQTPRTNVTALCVALTGLICLMRGWDVAGAGVMPVTLLADAVRVALQRNGGDLTPMVETGARYYRTAILYLTFVAVTFLAVIGTDARATWHTVMRDAVAAVVIGLLLGALVVAIGIFVAARRYRGFERRITPMMPSLIVVGAFIFMSTPLFLFYAGSHGDAFTPFLRPFAAALSLAIAFLVVMAVAASVYACRTAYRHLPEYFDLKSGSELGSLARSGRGFLTVFRVLMIAMWLICAAIVAAATVANLLACVAAIAPAWAPVRFRAGVNETAVVLALLLRQRMGGTALLLARAAHVTMAAIGLLFWSVPPLALLRTQLRGRRKLEEITQTSGDLVAIVEKVAANGGISAPAVALDDSRVPWAVAVVHGVLRPRPWIHVSSRVLTLLTPRELEAVIAHELAHLALGHCRRDSLLLWIGRLTLVGDSFVRITQQTAAHENEADRTAISQFKASRESIRTALAKMRNVAAAEAPPLFASGVPFNAPRLERYLPRDAYLALPFREQLRLGARALFDFYLFGGSRAYWHPDPKSRARALKDG